MYMLAGEECCACMSRHSHESSLVILAEGPPILDGSSMQNVILVDVLMPWANERHASSRPNALYRLAVRPKLLLEVMQVCQRAC